MSQIPFSIVLSLIVTLVKKIIEGIRILLFSDKKRLAGRLFDRFRPLLIFAGLYVLLYFVGNLLAAALISIGLYMLGDAAYALLVEQRFLISLLVTLAVVIVRWRKNMRKAVTAADPNAAIDSGASAASNGVGVVGGGEAVQRMEQLRLLSVFIRGLRVALVVISIIPLLVGSFLMLIGLQSEAASFLIFVAVCGVIWLVLMPFPNRLRTQANELFKESVVIHELERSFNNLRYDRNRSFPSEAFRHLNVFTGADSVRGNDWTEAEYKGIHFSMADAVIDQITIGSYTDDDGDTHQTTTRKGQFIGRILSFVFEEDFGEEVQVLSEGFMNAKFSRQNILMGIPDGWESVETELYEFNRQFNVFAASAQHALRVLRPQYIEAIQLVRGVVEYPILFCFHGHELFLFIDTEGHDMFDMSQKSRQSVARDMELLHQHIDMIRGFLEAMYLKGTTRGNASEETPIT